MLFTVFFQKRKFLEKEKEPKPTTTGNGIFQKKNARIPTKLETQNFLYGVAYDATWRQVENIQDFIFYISEQAKSYELSIPYYNFRKIVKNHTRKEIPSHKQFYPIQTWKLGFSKNFLIF